MTKSQRLVSQKVDFATLSYSTSEQDTGLTWIDGKEIYSKTVSLGNLPNAAQKTVAHGITNIATFVKVEGIAISDSGSGFPLGMVRPDAANLGIGMYASDTNIVIITGTDRRTWTGFATLYYTKTV